MVYLLDSTLNSLHISIASVNCYSISPLYSARSGQTISTVWLLWGCRGGAVLILARGHHCDPRPGPWHGELIQYSSQWWSPHLSSAQLLASLRVFYFRWHTGLLNTPQKGRYFSSQLAKIICMSMLKAQAKKEEKTIAKQQIFSPNSY